MIFGILGGDYRYKFLSEMLIKEGYTIKVYNNNYIDEYKYLDLDEFLNDIDILIAPIPFSKDNNNIFMPEFEPISIEFLLDKLNKYDIKVLCGGVFPEVVVRNANEMGIDILDFFKKESVAVLNAIPTAEGAIQTAMEESTRTLFNSKCLVLGYGRCGKILANMLRGIGANVKITHRNNIDCSYIRAYGFEGMGLYDIEKSIEEFDFIFNTIPALILDENILKKVNKDTIMIDLAQAPGGIDYNCVRDLGLKALYCPGLPGRVAPFTAAEVLKDCILDFINKI